MRAIVVHIQRHRLLGSPVPRRDPRHENARVEVSRGDVVSYSVDAGIPFAVGGATPRFLIDNVARGGVAVNR